ncbi:hypothetical protein [Asticcacaulis endophyticus]|uniref:Uncharacterized protein n=1 Tax=Asticcacaulis endophyticus TaxID=1395890 RepID=A0A918Q7R5_9CAUL|nr:hypothetical protein [Asticcacaulis endophyticus]GGZ37143.1 hypothetical protein GCM10011273_24390 [Asticcacaulis endophyticus]
MGLFSRNILSWNKELAFWSLQPPFNSLWEPMADGGTICPDGRIGSAPDALEALNSQGWALLKELIRFIEDSAGKRRSGAFSVTIDEEFANGLPKAD